MKRKIFTLFILTTLVFISFSYLTHAQTGTLKGIVIDEKTKEPIPFVSIIIEKDGKQISGTAADIDGNYTIDSLPSGIYVLIASNVGYYSKSTNEINIIENDVLVHNLNLKKYEYVLLIILEEVFNPIIINDIKPSGQTLTSYEIERMPW